MIRKTIILLLVSAFIVGCGEEEIDSSLVLSDAGAAETCGTNDRQWDSDSDFSKPYSSNWEATCFYPIAITVKGRYTSPKFDPFEITVDYDNINDFNRLSPKEVGELAYWMTAYYYLLDLPCVSNRAPYDILSKGHFVVTNDSKVFKQLFNETERDADNFTAFIHGNKELVCWEAPEDVYWTSIVRAWAWDRTNVGVVVHEMTHILSISVNGHSDPDHLDPRLWKAAGGEESLQALVIKTHDCTYFPSSCPDVDDGLLDGDDI